MSMYNHCIQLFVCIKCHKLNIIIIYILLYVLHIRRIMLLLAKLSLNVVNIKEQMNFKTNVSL